MLNTATARRWQRRLGWPVLLATCWFVLYTSLVAFDLSFGSSESSTLGVLFSSAHLSHPLGWLFLLSLVLTLVGAVLKTYMILVGH